MWRTSSGSDEHGPQDMLEEWTPMESRAQAAHTNDPPDQTLISPLSLSYYPSWMFVQPPCHLFGDHWCPEVLIAGTVVWLLGRAHQTIPVMRSTWNNRDVLLRIQEGEGFD